MRSEAQATKVTYAGLFMVALSTLMYEMLLTRIFSVTMWYHYAFMAISIAMFGLTVGGLIVYLLPSYQSQERVKYKLALNSNRFTVAIVLSALISLNIPRLGEGSLPAFSYLAVTYAVISIPFVFSGVCICLVLTRFPRQVSKLYAADLAGAALGCLFFLNVFKLTDGPTAVIVVALLANIGTLCFAAEEGSEKLRRGARIFGLILVSLIIIQTAHLKGSALLKLTWVKGGIEYPKLHEKWNSFSRIRVIGDLYNPVEPFGWGLSTTLPPGRNIRQLMLTIDASASTPLTAFDGDLKKLDYLTYDVTNIAHYIRSNSRVLVIGGGGGRDVLAALVFNQASVTAIEINEDILDTLNKTFGDFTGHLDNNPRVTFINDEARSYLSRQSKKFDIIHVSLIDTWASTSAGALALAENSLYTIEAWEIFLNRLQPQGILTFSRYFRRDIPGEMLRLTSLASASLLKLGVQDPRQNIVIVRQWPPEGESADTNAGVGTILVSKEPFSERDLVAVENVIHKMKFDLVLSPTYSLEPLFSTLASGNDPDDVVSKHPLRLAAPTDDNPYFFYMARLRNAFHRELWTQGAHMQVVSLLCILLSIVLGLSLLCIIIPLILTTERGTLKGSVPLFLFFAGIGLGFMMIEISQMQRLIVFLGHPTYALSVVLLTLLTSSSLGSYLTQKIQPSGSIGPAMILLALLLCALIICGIGTPHAMRAFHGSTTAQRILVAAVLLFPIGLFMGMPFPLGMKLASSYSLSLTPWLWGINGAASVCASVLAFVISLESGISTAFWVGVLCYVVASAAFVRAVRSSNKVG